MSQPDPRVVEINERASIIKTKTISHELKDLPASSTVEHRRRRRFRPEHVAATEDHGLEVDQHDDGQHSGREEQLKGFSGCNRSQHSYRYQLLFAAAWTHSINKSSIPSLVCNSSTTMHDDGCAILAALRRTHEPLRTSRAHANELAIKGQHTERGSAHGIKS